MSESHYIREKEMWEINNLMKRADMANDAFTHIFGEPTARENYEGVELEAMQADDRIKEDHWPPDEMESRYKY